MQVFQVGSKYYTIDDSTASNQGARSTLAETSLDEIRGRMGDKSAGFDFNKALQESISGTLRDNRIGAFSDIGSLGNWAKSQGFSVPNTIPMSQEFNKYLGETGQTYDAQTGFSGNPQQGIQGTQATQQGQAQGTIDPKTGQPIQPQNQAQANQGGGQTNAVQFDQNGQPIQDATLGANPQQSMPVSGKSGSLMLTTPSQPTNAYNQVYKDANGNVFEMGSNDPISQADFQKRGLNIDHINRLDEGFGNQPSGPIPTDPFNPEQSGSQFVSDMEALLKEFGISDQKSEREKTLKQFQDLQDEKTDKQVDINSNPWLSESLRVAELRKLDEKYELRENTLSNMLKYQDSQLDLAMEEIKFIATGIQSERNKLMDLALRKEESQVKLEQQLFENLNKVSQQDFERELDLANLSIRQKDLALSQYKAYKDTDGTSPAKLTGDQSKARGFAVNAENANQTLNTSTYKPGLFTFTLPNRLQSEERQSFEQGARAFVNSILRRESGATITDDEFNNKYKELIPTAGDSQTVINQKTQARAAAVENLNEAGLRTSGDILTTGQTSSGLKYTIIQ